MCLCIQEDLIEENLERTSDKIFLSQIMKQLHEITA